MFDAEQIKQILIDQRRTILAKPFGVEREVLEEIGEKIQLPHVIVISGIRRAGKSTLLRQIIKKYYHDKDFYYINFEDERLFGFTASGFNQLYESLVELFAEKKTFFIDEIQNVDHYETFVRRFYDAGFKFFITGSNAKMLSRELGTKLTGRHMDLVVTPFTFPEYLQFNKVEPDKEMIWHTESRALLKKRFDEYLVRGGMPEYLIYKDPEILLRTYEDIVIKDIAVRYKVENLYEMRMMYLFLITNFANRFSYHSLRKVSGLGSVNTVKNYLFYLTETFFITVINKFDYSLKKQNANDKKTYLTDNGFIRVLSTKTNKDKGWLLENLVFQVLEHYKNKVFYFSGRYECDFILQKDREITGAVQVTLDLSDKNKKREMNGLLEAMNYFNLQEGLILTMDQHSDIEAEDKKIAVRPVWRWLLEEHTA